MRAAVTDVPARGGTVTAPSCARRSLLHVGGRFRKNRPYFRVLGAYEKWVHWGAESSQVGKYFLSGGREVWDISKLYAFAIL